MVPSQPRSEKDPRPLFGVSHWIELIKDGDSIAAQQIWHHYFDRLVRSVRQNLRGQNRGVSDEEDIVVSVFESFYRAAENGRFPDLSDRRRPLAVTA